MKDIRRTILALRRLAGRGEHERAAFEAKAAALEAKYAGYIDTERAKEEFDAERTHDREARRATRSKAALAREPRAQGISPDAAWVLAQIRDRKAASPDSRVEGIVRVLRHNARVKDVQDTKEGAFFLMAPTAEPEDSMRMQQVVHWLRREEEQRQALREQHEGTRDPEAPHWIASFDTKQGEDVLEIGPAVEEDEDTLFAPGISPAGAWLRKTFGPSCQVAGEVGLGCPGNPPHTEKCLKRKTRRTR
jgi:hypothetical protein